MLSNNSWTLILLIAVLETVAMGIIQDSANKKNKSFIIGIIIYCLVAYVLYEILKSGNVATTNALWNATTVLFVSLMGIFYFDEKLDIYQYIGIFFAVLAVIFIELKSIKLLFK